MAGVAERKTNKQPHYDKYLLMPVIVEALPNIYVHYLGMYRYYQSRIQAVIEADFV